MFHGQLGAEDGLLRGLEHFLLLALVLRVEGHEVDHVIFWVSNVIINLLLLDSLFCIVVGAALAGIVVILILRVQ